MSVYKMTRFVIIFIFLSSGLYSQTILSSPAPPEEKEQDTPIREPSRNQRVEIEFGVPFTFRVIDEETPIYEDAVTATDQEAFETYYIGFKSVRPVDPREKWTLGVSFSATKSPTESLNLPSSLDGRELNTIEFIVTGAALTYYLKNMHKGPFFSLSGGSAIIDIGKGITYDEEISTRYFGPGIELSGGYAYNVSRNYSVLIATKLTYCGAYIDSISEYWGFFNVSFYIGFSF